MLANRDDSMVSPKAKNGTALRGHVEHHHYSGQTGFFFHIFISHKQSWYQSSVGGGDVEHECKHSLIRVFICTCHGTSLPVPRTGWWNRSQNTFSSGKLTLSTGNVKRRENTVTWPPQAPASS
jgi:hypothetical protein